MKKASLLLGILSLLMLMACSKSSDKKAVTPTDTEFVSGGLAKCVEVVNEPCELIYSEVDGSIPAQVIQLKLKLKLKKESPELQNVDAQDIDFTTLLAVATVNLEDENGVKIQDLSIKQEDILKLKKLLQGKEGDLKEITFMGEFHNSEDAPKWFENAAKFTPNLTADIVGGKAIPSTVTLTGSIGQYPICMKLKVEDDDVKGYYYYTKNADTPKARLFLSGEIDEEGRIVLDEKTAEGLSTGHFDGVYSDDKFNGNFMSYAGKNYQFNLNKTAEGEDIDAIIATVPSATEGGSSGVEIILPSQLQGKVGIVPGSYQVVEGSYGFPEISITFQLLKTVDTVPLSSEYGQLWIVGVGQDASGRDVEELLPNYREWRTDDSDGEEFKAFLESSPGETITLNFTGDNEGDVPLGISKVAKFKLKITN